MSPASKSKSKDKPAAKAVKDNTASKSTVASVNGGNGAAASAYDPVSGMFHALELVPSASLPTPQSNGRFRTIDETEEHSGSSLGTAADYDSVSNNGSCSGESEDQQKEKTSAGLMSRTEPIPGSDIDKREKIRQKNERKHQRQREKRTQELHERCCSYLTSRKLESLAQKLVAMGFTCEQATMALIQNEGRLEESALWLTEGGEESKRQAPSNLDGVDPKIDIADELARIADLGLTFKCTKQEVERAIVACEGDLKKAEETLRTQKQAPTVAQAKLEESGYHPIVSANGLHNNNRMATSNQSSTVRTQQKAVAPAVGQQRRDEREFNYTKAAVTSGVPSVEPTNRNLQSLRKVQPKPDWTKPHTLAPLEKRWSNTSSSSTTYSLASPIQVAAAQTKPEPRYVETAGSDVKANLVGMTLREPIKMMQRQQANVTRQNLPSTRIGLSASPPASTGWYPSSTNPMEMMKLGNGGLGQQLRNMALNGSTSQQFYPQNIHQQLISGPVESNGAGWCGSWSMQGTSRSSTSSTSLAVPSSLGLFTGWGSTGTSSSSPVDWSTRGSMPQCDYASIDWSLESTPMPLLSSSIKGERLYDNTWHASYMPSKASRPLVNGGSCVAGLQDGSLMMDHAAPSAGSHEWTSPFGGKDLFRVPRQFVTSPSP
ncbi:uncharacterized protein M6B38_184740 [Iris pallida]|uniref:UBA domain-containing protein n=1 Tax=Iris pallida TaxID=29817 RepID=A0AAX6EL39_IRIPA|nr:uncharacterized protein M6B38_184740 [Iris pallida]